MTRYLVVAPVQCQVPDTGSGSATACGHQSSVGDQQTMTPAPVAFNSPMLQQRSDLDLVLLFAVKTNMYQSYIIVKIYVCDVSTVLGPLAVARLQRTMMK